MIYRIIADLIVVIHACYVGFVAFGLVAIVVGLLLRKAWARNFWFRMLHLLAIGYVVFEEAANLRCPLTIWENQFRQLAGQSSYPGDFLGYWAHRLIFFDFPPSYFTALYVTVGLTVLGIFVFGPPRRPFAKRSSTQGSVVVMPNSK